MNVLQLTDFYPPVIGGLERYVQSLSGELVRRGHRVSVATLTPAAEPAAEPVDGVRVHRITGWNRHLDRFYQQGSHNFHLTVPDPAVVRELQRIIDAERPDVINAHSWILHSLLAVPKLRGAKLVHTLHDYGLVCARKTYINPREWPVCDGPKFAKCIACASDQYGRVKSLAITTGLFAMQPAQRRLDAVIAVSNALADAMSDDVQSRIGAPIIVVPGFISDEWLTGISDEWPTGISDEWLTGISDEWPTGISDERLTGVSDERLAGVSDERLSRGRPSFLPADDGYTLFVGTLGRHKGVDVLAEAYRNGDADGPLVVLGPRRPDTPEFPPDVIVRHDVAHEDVMAAWDRSGLAVVPSVWGEPFGLVALEAMARHKPVVAAASGGLVDVIEHERTGLLVEPGSSQALGAAISRIRNDNEFARALGNAGAVKARDYALSVIAGRIESVYEDVLGHG